MNLTELYLNNQPKLFGVLRNGVMVDCKVLTLFLIGIYDQRNNTNCLSQLHLDKEDFDILVKFKEQMRISKFSVTPAILAEFCNHVQNKLGLQRFPLLIKEIKVFLEDLIEKYYPKDEIIKIRKFGEFDFTDISIFLASERDKYNLITADIALSQLCANENVLSISIDELRNLSLIFRQ